MLENSTQPLSVAALFAEREAHLRHEKEMEEQLAHKKEEELADYKKRLEEFKLSKAFTDSLAARIRRAFDHGETELMFASFPSNFCTDEGRAINNVGESPINKPGQNGGTQDTEPQWLATLPKGARPLYDYWKSSLRPGGFSFSARIINYPGGMPGDVGLFISWPKSPLEGTAAAT